MSSPLISTILPVYNRAEMLQRAVDSVFSQSYRPIEIVIVNDGSIDNTAEIADQIAAKHPSIVKVIHQQNSGPGLAREAGRRACSGEFIQYLDSDDWLLPNKFEDQIQVWRDDNSVDIVYGKTKLVDADGNTLKAPSKDTGILRDHLFPALLVDRWWHTSTPLYSRSISDKAGAWPDKRPEDWDLESRMGAENAKLGYADVYVSCHLEHNGPDRVSQGDFESYLLDESWFLPRLYDCAIKAGVKLGTPEFDHFSKWAFMRARHLGRIGETGRAEKLFQLSLRSADVPSSAQKLARVLKGCLGWRAVGQLAALVEAWRR